MFELWVDFLCVVVIVIELVMGEGGYYFVFFSFLCVLRDIVNDYGILFIFDEV